MEGASRRPLLPRVRISPALTDHGEDEAGGLAGLAAAAAGAATLRGEWTSAGQLRGGDVRAAGRGVVSRALGRQTRLGALSGKR